MFTQFHKLLKIILAFNDNSKCIRYLVSNYLDQWEVSILITWSILSNQRARNVPQNEVQTNYVPHVPQMRYTWGTKTRTPQDENKFTDFWVDLMKIWFFGKIWHFHSMDFLDGVKGQNSKNICINVTFSHTICEK